MPIATTDLVAYAAANKPTNDTAQGGGAIDALTRAFFTQLSANALIAVQSDGADTRTLTVSGRTPAGVIDSDVLTLNGASEVVGAKTFERVHSLTLSASSGTRTVTVKQGAGGATLATIPINETGANSNFLNSASEAGAVTRYDKVFYKNAHATLTLTDAKVTLTADPSSRIRIGLATSKGDSATIANRKTAPAGITFVDDGVDQSIPGTILEAGAAIGVWVEQALLAADAPFRSSYTLQLAGQST